MKTLHVEIPDNLAAEVEAYVRAGWFACEAEVIRAALTDFIRRHRIELLDRFMREDIEWALKHSKDAP